MDETEKKNHIGTINKEAYKFKSQLTKVYLIFKFTMYFGVKSIKKHVNQILVIPNIFMSVFKN